MSAAQRYQQALGYYLGDLGMTPDSPMMATDWAVLHDVIRQGVPVRNALLMRSRVASRVFDRSVMPRTTLQSKRRAGRLSSVQSERLLRVGRIYARAAVVFGDRNRGKAWMERANPMLNRTPPAEMLSNEAGARLIEEVLGRLEHGIAA